MASAHSEFKKLRIVLLGNTGVGKSATANVLIGRDSFKETETRECEIRHGRVKNNNISVIDTPGINNTSITPEQMRDQMKKCMLLSSPGPHVFLLVIRLGRFTEDERDAVKWIQENIGEEALMFTMVLFTGKEGMTISQLNTYFQDDRIQELIISCGGGYNIMNSKREVNPAQITQLLEKIEAVIQQNAGQYYTDEMYQKVQRREPPEDEFVLVGAVTSITEFEELRIVLLGNTGVGKSATANVLIGRDTFKETKTRKCDIQRRRVKDRNISVIDTPGINNTLITPEQMRDQMKKCMLLSSPGPHVFLLVIRLGRFTEDERNAVKWIREIFGEEALMFTMVLFTGKEGMTKSQLNTYFQDDEIKKLISSCGGGYDVINSKREINPGQITKLLEKIEDVIQLNGGQYYTEKMYQKAQRRERPRNPLKIGALTALGVALVIGYVLKS